MMTIDVKKTWPPEVVVVRGHKTAIFMFNPKIPGDFEKAIDSAIQGAGSPAWAPEMIAKTAAAFKDQPTLATIWR